MAIVLTILGFIFLILCHEELLFYLIIHQKLKNCEKSDYVYHVLLDI